MLEFIVFSFLGSLIMFLIYNNINRNVLSAKGNVLVVAMLTIANISTAVLSPSFELTTIAYLVIAVAMLSAVSQRKTKIMPLSIVCAIFSVIIMLLSANITGAVIIFIYLLSQGNIAIGRDIQNDAVMSLIYIGITFVISFIISHLFGNYLKRKLAIFDSTLKRKLAIYLLYGTVITLLVYFILIFFRYMIDDEIILTFAYSIALSTSFIYLMFATFAFANNTRLELELRHKEELAQNLQKYAEQVDSVSQEMQRFKHDNLNLMLGFSQLLENRDIDSLQSYYDKYMDTFKKSIAVSDAIAKKLELIQIPTLVGILLAKCVQAKQQNTEMWLEVDEIITIPNIDYVPLDLCRVAGILLDNALEACKGVVGAEVRVSAMSMDNYTSFIFTNTCHTPPPINKMFEKGFSTKGNSRGTGLYSATQIVASNRHLVLDTEIEKGTFVQMLKILK